jgi:hypothetical protein
MAKGGGVKFELLFLYNASSGWNTASFKVSVLFSCCRAAVVDAAGPGDEQKIPKQHRGAKDVCFSLEVTSPSSRHTIGASPHARLRVSPCWTWRRRERLRRRQSTAETNSSDRSNCSFKRSITAAAHVCCRPPH